VDEQTQCGARCGLDSGVVQYHHGKR
jgi:hypothetical protein